MNLLWRRLRAWETLDLDFLAWTTRNLLEVHYWAQFITAASENAAAFMGKAEAEQGELFRRFLEQMGDSSNIDRFAMRALADQTPGKHSHFTTSDPLLFMECSKYVHVSAWLLNGYDRHMEDDYMRHQLIAFSLHYASAITRLLIRSNSQTKSLLAESQSIN